MFGLPTEEEKKDLQRYARDESPWGAFDTPYNFPALKVDYVPVDSPVPTGAWRAVDYPSRVFARESFMAARAKRTFSRYRCGGVPTSSQKTRAKWNGLMPTA